MTALVAVLLRDDHTKRLAVATVREGHDDRGDIDPFAARRSDGFMCPSQVLAGDVPEQMTGTRHLDGEPIVRIARLDFECHKDVELVALRRPQRLNAKRVNERTSDTRLVLRDTSDSYTRRHGDDWLVAFGLDHNGVCLAASSGGLSCLDHSRVLFFSGSGGVDERNMCAHLGFVGLDLSRRHWPLPSSKQSHDLPFPGSGDHATPAQGPAAMGGAA